MGARLDQTAVAAILKTIYPKDRVREMVYKNNAFLALCPKDEAFYGDYYRIATRFGTPQGGSATFSTASSNKEASSYAKFDLTRKKDYVVASIEGETIRATSNDAGALQRALQTEMDGAILTATRSLAIAMYKSGKGERATLTTALPAATTLTLPTIDDITNFEKGMYVQVLDSTDGTTLLSSGAQAQITNVNRVEGKLTIGANWSATFGSSDVGDWIIRAGDANAMISGLDAWCPTAAPSSTAFFGQNRTLDSRLYGIFLSASGGTIEEALVDAIHLVSREGGNTSHIFMNPRDRANLVKNLGSKVNYSRVESNVAGIGFHSIQVEGDKGPVDVISDPNCPKGKVYGLQMDTWVLATLEEAPQILDFDSNKFLRETSADAYEVRVGYYGQLGCRAPGWNFVLSL